MLKSTEREFKKFEKNGDLMILSHDVYLAPLMDVTIVKPTSLGKPILINPDFVRYTGDTTCRAVVKTQQIFNDLGLDVVSDQAEFIREYGRYFRSKAPAVDFLKGKVNKIALVLLDLIINGKAQTFYKSSWGVNMNSCAFTGVNDFGTPQFENVSRNCFYEVPSGVSLFQNEDDKSIYDFNMEMLKMFNLLNDVQLQSRPALLDDYLRTKRLKFLFRINKRREPVFTEYLINVGIEIPDTLCYSGSESRLSTSSHIIKDSVFDTLLSHIIYKKKLFNEMIKSQMMSTFIDIKKEGEFWYTRTGSYYRVKLEEPELVLLIEILGYDLEAKKGSVITWRIMDGIFNKIEAFYTQYENENSSVPSGPDTSKFTATKSGWVKVGSDFRAGETQYSCGQYFYRAIKVGGNFKYGHPYSLTKFVLMYIQKHFRFPIHGSRDLSIRENSGTNWSAIGIG